MHDTLCPFFMATMLTGLTEIWCESDQNFLDLPIHQDIQTLMGLSSVTIKIPQLTRKNWNKLLRIYLFFD